MTDGQNPTSISSLWRNLKRALVSSPDIQNNSTICLECGMGVMNTSNFSNSNDGNPVLVSERSSDPNGAELSAKRQKLNITADKITPTEESSFMEIMKNLLSCSICLEVNNYSNQCPNGHLICITCSGRLQQTPGDLNCPVCRISLKQGLHRSLLAEQLTSELPAACRFCNSIMAVKSIKKHETNECSKRMVQCKYKMFGCGWIGVEEESGEHEDTCSVSNKTVGLLHDIVMDNVNKDSQLLQNPLQVWRAIISKVRVQPVGSRMLIRQTTLNKTLGEDPGQLVFKSPIIRVPFSCCNMHGFYLDIWITKASENESEKWQYVLKSENRTKLTVNFFLAGLKVNENIDIEVHDSLHSHHFESSHKESLVNEFKLFSLDHDKDIPKIYSLDTIFAEICFITERERSEKSHGILSSPEEEESNPFMSTGSDSNVVFTLFSPTSSASRSINTSNVILTTNEDANITNEIEPSHEEDIVITVTDNIDSGDDISIENRENIAMRNNHSFVAVPSVFINPSASVFAYSPFPIENSFVNNNMPQATRVTRENLIFEQPMPQQIPEQNQPDTITEQELIRLQNFNGSRSNNTMANAQLITQDLNRVVREPIHMSMFYPPQTIVSPYITNSVSPIAIRPTASSRNILVRPRLHSNPLSFRQLHILTNSDEISALNSYENINNDTPAADVAYNTPIDPNEEQYNQPPMNAPNYISSYPYILNQSVPLQDTISQEEIEH